MGDAASGVHTTGCIHGMVGGDKKLMAEASGGGTENELDGMVGGDNQDETIRNILEAAGPLVRMGLHRATVEVGQFRTIANAARRGERGEVIEISDIREDTHIKVRHRSLLS